MPAMAATRAPVTVREPRIFAVSEGELAAHAAFMTKIDHPIWDTGRGA
jgi:DNA polymerase-3 subunit epsilon